MLLEPGYVINCFSLYNLVCPSIGPAMLAPLLVEGLHCRFNFSKLELCCMTANVRCTLNPKFTTLQILVKPDGRQMEVLHSLGLQLLFSKDTRGSRCRTSLALLGFSRSK